MSQPGFRVRWHALSLRRACRPPTACTPFASCSGRATRPPDTRKRSGDKALGMDGVKIHERQRPKEDDRQPGSQGRRQVFVIAQVLAGEARRKEDGAEPEAKS